MFAGNVLCCVYRSGEHQQSHSGQRPLECTVCCKQFTKPSVLVRHMRVHTGEKPYQCSLCNKSFSQSSGLQQHKHSVHSTITESREKPHKCQVCDKAFMVPGMLERHMTVHTGEKPYKCTPCDSSFSRTGDLLQHEYSVYGKRVQYEYCCVSCQKQFKVDCELSADAVLHMCKRCSDLQTACGITTH